MQLTELSIQALRRSMAVVTTVAMGLVSAASSTAQENAVHIASVVYLQESASSPSDRAASEIAEQGSPSATAETTTAPAEQAGPIRMGLSDGLTQVPQAPGQPAASAAPNAAAQPPATGPQVTTLGRNNNYRSLAAAPTYVSPFVSLTGIGDSTASPASDQYFGSASHRSLLKMPEMFGDFRRPGTALSFDPNFLSLLPDDDAHSDERPTDFPSASSFSGLRISENNFALPQDRVWLGYNHFHNAYLQPGGDISLDRFVMGMEKTFFGGSSSVEFRLPMSAGISLDSAFVGPTAYSGGSFGNLSFILKRVLFANDKSVLAFGLGIEVPTGSESHASDTLNGLAEVTVDPAAVYLTPYLGAMRRFDDIWFAQGFLQVDVPTGGDSLIVSLSGGPAESFKMNQPPLLQVDVGLGAWLLTPGTGNSFGLAATSEIHVATALADADTFTVADPLTLPNVFINVDSSIRTVVNSTHGLQASLPNGWALRTGVAVPLLTERIFDTEILVQLNRRY